MRFLTGDAVCIVLATMKKLRRHNKSAMCVCVCVVIPFILDVRFVDVPDGVTQEEGHTGILIHLLSAVLALIFWREGFSRSFLSSTVRSNFVY